MQERPIEVVAAKRVRGRPTVVAVARLARVRPSAIVDCVGVRYHRSGNQDSPVGLRQLDTGRLGDVVA